MRRPVRGWIVGCLLLALPGPARAAGEVVIGMSAAFNGPSRGLGIELYRGAMACFAEVNSRGGVHGRQIVLKAYDDGYNPDPAIANTRRLLHEDHAFLLFGYVGTPTVTRVLPLLKLHEKESIYLFCPFTGAEPMREGPYAAFVYNLRASYRDETRGLVNHFVDLGRKRIAVYYQIDAYGRSGWDGVRRALAERGLRICGEATYRRGTPFAASMREQVKILERGSPDAVICVGAYAACAAFIRDARDAGLNVPIANLSFVGSEILLARLKEAGESAGKDYTRDLINTQVVPSYHDTTLPAVQEYRARMDKHRPSPPGFAGGVYHPLHYGYTSFEGYLSARLVEKVLKKLGPKLDRKGLAAAAESLEDIPLGIDQKALFGPGRRQALRDVYYTVYEKGESVPLRDWSRWKP
jgi:ABC-type branched-subunit amino acid transport system substrate-binding protein